MELFRDLFSVHTGAPFTTSRPLSLPMYNADTVHNSHPHTHDTCLGHWLMPVPLIPHRCLAAVSGYKMPGRMRSRSFLPGFKFYWLIMLYKEYSVSILLARSTISGFVRVIVNMLSHLCFASVITMCYLQSGERFLRVILQK